MQLPSRFLTWFQAAAAARNAGKRLPSNAEWQAAALGTTDGPPCNVGALNLGQSGEVGLTGTAGCVSDVGAFDMVGNLDEWVADWVPRSENPCPGLWGPGASFSNEAQCLGGAGTVPPGGPGTLIRGGNFGVGSSANTFAGVFSVIGSMSPSTPGIMPAVPATSFVGFRAAR